MDAPKRLTQKGYRPRLIEERLDTLMRAFGCVEINGPKWCGKTWTALSRSVSVSRLDEAWRSARRQRLTQAWRSSAMRHTWSMNGRRCPRFGMPPGASWTRAATNAGHFLLTGSTALKSEERSHVRHSGTGRIARLSMRPMALCESGDGEPLVSLASLFKGEGFAPQRRESTVDDVARWCCRGRLACKSWAFGRSCARDGKPVRALGARRQRAG